MTQRELALRLKKPASYVAKCEVGSRRIDPVELILWCRACGMPSTKAIAEVEKQV